MIHGPSSMKSFATLANRRNFSTFTFATFVAGCTNFQEVWPDEGHLDMHKVAQTLRDVEYPYMLMPDHAPGHSDDPSPPGVSGRVRQAWAFQFGYIIALIQAVNSE